MPAERLVEAGAAVEVGHAEGDDAEPGREVRGCCHAASVGRGTDSGAPGRAVRREQGGTGRDAGRTRAGRAPDEGRTRTGRGPDQAGRGRTGAGRCPVAARPAADRPGAQRA